MMAEVVGGMGLNGKGNQVQYLRFKLTCYKFIIYGTETECSDSVKIHYQRPISTKAFKLIKLMEKTMITMVISELNNCF